jgi:hypothetical protein
MQLQGAGGLPARDDDRLASGETRQSTAARAGHNGDGLLRRAVWGRTTLGTTPIDEQFQTIWKPPPGVGCNWPVRAYLQHIWALTSLGWTEELRPKQALPVYASA